MPASGSRLTIAVDGPASSGKGTVARGAARALRYRYLDTGAMYRAVALYAARQRIDFDDGPAIAAIARALDFDFVWDGDVLRVLVNGEDLTRAIRTDEVGQGASSVSRHAEVREALLGLQRELARDGGVVMDGRDIGTVVLPDADLKIYLDAALGERARRRHDELLRRGEARSLEAVRDALAARDLQDRQRPVAPLCAAADAVSIDTTSLTAMQVVEQVLLLAAMRIREQSER